MAVIVVVGELSDSEVDGPGQDEPHYRVILCLLPSSSSSFIFLEHVGFNFGIVC